MNVDQTLYFEQVGQSDKWTIEVVSNIRLSESVMFDRRVVDDLTKAFSIRLANTGETSIVVGMPHATYKLIKLFI